MANQLVNMVEPAISGSFKYRGYLDASFTGGVGCNGSNSLELSTTQGFKYSNWFFMGVGAGVNVLFAGQDDFTAYSPGYPGTGNAPQHKVHDTGVVIPLFSDFRFNIGAENAVSVFIDLKLGASFPVGNTYLRTPDGILDYSEGFYFRPTLGVRIPIKSDDSRKAINIGASYQLITNNYWTYGGYYDNATLNSLGATIGFEW